MIEREALPQEEKTDGCDETAMAQVLNDLCF